MSAQPDPGYMYVYDYLSVPLPPDSYRMHVSTDLSFTDLSHKNESHKLGDDKYFDVVGPRFNLAPGEIAGVYPPRNGHGPFGEVLAQVAIKRRTLPWERSIDKGKPIADPKDGKGLTNYPTPWMALLLFEEGEYTLLQGQPLQSVVGSAAFARLGSPQNILCDAIETDADVLASIMPSKEELQLLTHVRQVNIDDRELSVEGSNGWFAVVMTNRLPTPNAKCRVCLVSLEQRQDLVPANPPASTIPVPALPIEFIGGSQDIGPQLNARATVKEYNVPGQGIVYQLTPAKVRLVLLHSWQFTCEGDGTFFNLMQNLDVGMIGKTEVPDQPPLTDTGHIAIELDDRVGTRESALYRGPLVPMQLTRDPLGPYHSADQARRATPEAGVEDVSYAAAFELGRLLAAADARLAQELMRWRRESYKQAVRVDLLSAIEKVIAMSLPGPLEEKLSTAVSPYVAVAATGLLVKGSGPIADRYGIQAATLTPGFNPQIMQAAWGLSSPAEAQAILGANPGTLGLSVSAQAQTPRPNTTLEDVVKDQTSIQRLGAARDQILANVKTRVGG
jgi:hypothetical protein